MLMLKTGQQEHPPATYPNGGGYSDQEAQKRKNTVAKDKSPTFAHTPQPPLQSFARKQKTPKLALVPQKTKNSPSCPVGKSKTEQKEEIWREKKKTVGRGGKGRT